MATITLSIDDALLEAARARAVNEGTSVNEICRQAIERYARRNEDRLARYLELKASIDANPGVSGEPLPPITREQLYDEMFAERGLDPKRGGSE